jgi:hypothetical protein
VDRVDDADILFRAGVVTTCTMMFDVRVDRGQFRGRQRRVGQGLSGVVADTEIRADLLGFRCAEFGVEGQRVLVLLAGLDRVGEGAIGVAEAGVGTGVLVAVIDSGGDAVRGGVVLDGVGGAVDAAGGLAQPVQR